VKRPDGDIEVLPASRYIPHPKKAPGEEISEEEEAKKNDKLINIVYNDGQYFLYEPRNVESNSYNIIDNHLWLAARFMP
jgi:hypothetical protein